MVKNHTLFFKRFQRLGVLPWLCSDVSPGTYLQSAPEHTDHQHGHGQVVGKYIPPWLQNPEGRLLLRELPELRHRNHVSEKREITGELIYLYAQPTALLTTFEILLQLVGFSGLNQSRSCHGTSEF